MSDTRFRLRTADVGDAGDDALDEPVELPGIVDGRLAGDEGQHDPVDERQGGGRLVVDQRRVRRAAGRMPLGDDVAGQCVEPVRRLAERGGQFRVPAGQQREFVARLGTGQPRLAVHVHDDAGQPGGAGELGGVILGELGHHREVGDVELGQPAGHGVHQRLAGAEVERRGAGRDAGAVVDLRVADTVQPVAAQQFDCGVGELAAPLRGVVLSAGSDAPQSKTGRSWARWVLRGSGRRSTAWPARRRPASAARG